MRDLVDGYITVVLLGVAVLSVGWAAATNHVRRRRGLGLWQWRGLSWEERWRVVVPHWFLGKSFLLLWLGLAIMWPLITGTSIGKQDWARYLLGMILTYFFGAKMLAWFVWTKLPERDVVLHEERDAAAAEVRALAADAVRAANARKEIP